MAEATVWPNSSTNSVRRVRRSPQQPWWAARGRSPSDEAESAGLLPCRNGRNGIHGIRYGASPRARATIAKNRRRWLKTERASYSVTRRDVFAGRHRAERARELCLWIHIHPSSASCLRCGVPPSVCASLRCPGGQQRKRERTSQRGVRRKKKKEKNSKWAAEVAGPKGGLGPRACFPFYFSLLFQGSRFRFNLNSKLPIQISNFPRVEINTTENITSTIFNFIIYYFPCYLFVGGIYGFINCFLSHCLFYIFIYNLRSSLT